MYDVTNPLSPLLELTPASPLMCLQYRYLQFYISYLRYLHSIYNTFIHLQYLLHSRRETNLLAGGTLAGGLVLVDTRAGGGFTNIQNI